jgi:hypothetical protein
MTVLQSYMHHHAAGFNVVSLHFVVRLVCLNTAALVMLR